MNKRITFILVMFLLTASTGLASLTDGLVAYYPFDGNANDVSGSGNNATAYNDYEYLDGVSSEAIRLVGSGHTGLNGGHVILPFIALNEFPAFTISMWVNHQGTTSNHGGYFVSFGAALDCSGQGDRVSIGDAGFGFPDTSLIFQAGDMSAGGGGGQVDLPYPSDFAGIWNHLVLRADNGVLTGFLNGLSVGTDSYKLNSMSSVAGLGCSWFNCGGTESNRFIGMIDEVRIYNRALSGSEIEDLAGETPEPPAIEAAIDIDPDTLNLNSKGKWITCYIKLPEAYDVDDIDVDSILLEYLLQVQHSDVQDDVLMVKFDRQDVMAYIELVLEIELPADVTLMVTGELTDGTPFEGSDTIRVIDKGGKK